MKKTTIWAIIVILIVIIAGYLLYQNQIELEINNTIKIGVIAPLTGETSRHGQSVKEGVALAVKQINKEGGIKGRNLEVIYEDDQCDQSNGLNAAYKLIEIDLVPVIIGPVCSSVAMAVSPIVEKAKVVILTPVASVPDLKYAGDFIFRNRVSGGQHGIKMAEFSYNQLKAKTAAILYINLDNGVGYKNSFEERFKILGGEILNSEAYEKGTTDFRLQLSKIKSTNSEVLFIGGQAYENAVRQAQELGVESQIIGPITIETPELLEIAGSAAEGIYYSYPSFDSDKSDPIVAEYQDEYISEYGERSEAYAANAYDAAMLIAKALKECDKNTSCIRDYLYSVKDYPGVSGVTTFDEFGEVSKPLIIKTIKNGEFVKYE